MRWLRIFAMLVPVWALDPSLSLSQYARKLWQVEDGLPQNYVTWISQSVDGYLLVGTSGGAARFDGLRFTPLVLDPATGSTREWITVVQPGIDSKTTWVATRDAGFYQLGSTRRHWPLRFDNLIVDKQGDPVALGSGLHKRIDGEMKQVRAGLTPADPSWSGLLEIPGAGLVAAAGQGLFLFRDLWQAPALLLPPTAPEGRVLAVTAAARRGGVWLGTSQGLCHARLQGGRLTSLTPIAGVTGPVVSVVEDRDGVVWAGTWGLGMWRVVEGRAERFTTRDGLSDDFVHALFEDREGNLWIGTRAGLSRWKSTPIVPFGQTEGLDGQFVSTVSGDASGGVWIGTWRSGLYRVSGGVAARVGLPSADLKVLVRATATAPDGALWLSDWQALFRREGSTWKKFDGAALGYQPQIHALLFDRLGRLWVGADEGLFRHGDGGLGHAESKLRGHSIRALLEDSKGRIWAGGPDGLWRVDGENARKIEGLPSPIVTSVSEDSGGRIWATTRANGLALIEDGGVRVVDHRHGLPALPLYSAIDDGRGSMWLSSPAGLFQVQRPLLEDVVTGRRTRLAVNSWGQEDGMRTIECQNVGYPSAWKDSRGDLWFATVRGAVRVRPRAVSVPDAPAVLMESTESVRQSHNVRFTAARLGAPSRVEFRYRMAATQPEWTYLGGERTIRYDSLPAGTHTLLIAARERGGEWGGTTEVYLTQAPRFHETWWFRLLVLALVAGALTGVYRWRVYLLRVRYSGMIAERNRIAREWHDTLLAGFSAISWQLDVTLKRIRDKPDAAADTVEVARTMVQHYRAEARRVIWDMRHETPEKESLADTISSALQQLTQGREIVSEVAVEGSARPVPGEMAQNLLRICQEAAGNAVRHGEPARIDVKLRYGPGSVGLTVRDDGRGFDPQSVAPGHFGIQIMAERARRFGGELAVESRAGAGTTVTAAIPLGTP